MRQSIETRLQKAERRFADWIAGVHRLSDAELDGLIAWLRRPDPRDEEWVMSVLRSERLIPGPAIDLRRRLERVEATRSAGAPNHIMTNRCLADGEAAEAIANWREWVADGHASVSGNVLWIMDPPLIVAEGGERFAKPNRQLHGVASHARDWFDDGDDDFVPDWAGRLRCRLMEPKPSTSLMRLMPSCKGIPSEHRPD